MKRFYNYILAFIGLVVAFVGMATLISFMIDMLTGFGIVLSDAMRNSLAIFPFFSDRWSAALADHVATDAGGSHGTGRDGRSCPPVAGAKSLSVSGVVRFGYWRHGDRGGAGIQLLRVVLTGDAGRISSTTS